MLARLTLFLPEAVYLVMVVVLFFMTLASRPSLRRSYGTAFFFSALGVVITAACWDQEGILFFYAYRVDLFSQIFKLILCVATFLVVSICRDLTGIEERHHPEFFLFLSTCTLGMMLLVSAVELMTLYVALELSSFSLYLLVPLRKGDGLDVEAAIKYLFIGVLASCVMLFGMSYVFGVTHTTYLAEIIRNLPQLIHQPGAAVGLVLLLAGFFFKLAVFPFHFWAPDVYHGAANQVTTFIATASKAAAVALLIRLTALSDGKSLYLMHVLVALSLASMFYGNLVAIVQTSIKRMLAYSTVAHAGYVLMGILAMNQLGYSSAIFYTLAYMVMNFAAFLVVVLLSTEGQNLNISDLAGLHKRSPLLALTLMMALFSLAGIPPTVGFTGKFLVFAAAMKEGYFWLVVMGMVNATISLYYYLMVIKAAYLTEPAVEQPAVALSLPVRVLNYGLIAAMVYFGMLPHHFTDLADQAVKRLM
ncbi:MAG: NADH-quinone oxidoreductase subunit N [Thermodesulfobacteriota bacterium]